MDFPETKVLNLVDCVQPHVHNPRSRVTPDPLCKLCQSLFEWEEGEVEKNEILLEKERVLDESELRETQLRCAMCRLLYIVALRYQYAIGKSPTDVELKFEMGGAFRIDELFLLFVYCTEQPTSFSIDIKSHVDDMDMPVVPRNSSPTVAENLILEWVREALAVCISAHPNCSQDASTTFLPTRLIDVDTAESQWVTKLVLSTDLLRSGLQYVTLSHKWGKEQITVLTTENIHMFQASICVDKLPQTFQDAITVTRDLGVQYLWIDSLCIIQNSESDWRAEAATMQDVYSNCLLNIAASMSDKPSQGLRSHRSPETCDLVHIRARFGQDEQVYSCYYDAWGDIAGVAPLNRRGWVVQERLLSPRTAHFASSTFWECRTTRTSEVNPSGSDRRGKTRKIWPSLSLHEYPGWALRLWHETVEVYSKCSLTMPGDKLIAISGVVKILQGVIDQKYLAGLWDSHIVPGLMWVAAFDQEGFNAGKTHWVPDRAPSWSWASVDGPVQLDYLDEFQLALIQVTETGTTPLYDDPFGQVSAGFIKLRGNIYRLGPFDTVWEVVWQGKDLEYCIALDDYGDKRIHEEHDTFALPIATGCVSNINARNAGRTQHFALLLQAANTDYGPDAYVRIGFAILNNDGYICGTEVQCINWEETPWDTSTLSEIVLV